jgi:hypothetical protein
VGSRIAHGQSDHQARNDVPKPEKHPPTIIVGQCIILEHTSRMNAVNTATLLRANSRESRMVLCAPCFD